MSRPAKIQKKKLNLETYKFDTTEYVKISSVPRREPKTGRLVLKKAKEADQARP